MVENDIAEERDEFAAPDAVAPEFVVRRSRGRDARARAPRSRQGPWHPGAGRADPVALLDEQATRRDPDIVPLRYERMSVSPFAFFRGAALLMASDLATAPRTDITVQLCGDAHLSNFGLFGTPERRLIFDMNDFDETFPGPFEWDLKRLATSFAVAGRHRGFTTEEISACVRAAVVGYRKAMRRAADAHVLDAWYDHFDADSARRRIRAERDRRRADDETVARLDAAVKKARKRDRMRSFAKLVHVVDGRLRIIANPPLVTPVEDLVPEVGTQLDDLAIMRELLASYQDTLPGDRHPISEYRYRHMARSVGGIGSVGTRAWVILLSGRDDSDPLLLQAKTAQPSVLERFLGPGGQDSEGERVVRGQRLMQAASDIFLGWQRVTGADGITRDFYVRQLHDWKGGIDPDTMTPRGAALYARICGETLARAHARGGDRLEIAGYLGRGRAFEEAICAFADTYADQNDQDLATFRDALTSGRLPSMSTTPSTESS
ncbi:DUF2252 domain-containing protein [Microbacterium sp. NPDC058269]|uniref:DUF2252 domain-containing protein n=1 Tax=Microbacterium sp. NPDC058269 TaxID=3346414 RepID=UPI0036D850A8